MKGVEIPTDLARKQPRGCGRAIGLHGSPRLGVLDRDVDGSGFGDGLAQMRLLSAALRHQDAQARLVDLFDAGDLGRAGTT